MTKSLLTFTAAIALSFAGVSPALAGDLAAQNAACQEAVAQGLPATLSDTQIRFSKRRGAGKKQRLFYALSNDEGRGTATCIKMRDDIQEVRFDKTFRTVIAAAQ